MAKREPTSPPEDEEKKIHVLCATCQHYKGVLPVQYQGTESIPPELIDPESLTPSTPFVHICSAFPHPGGIPNEVLFSKRGHRRRLDGDHEVQYEPRFPILFNSLKQWRAYNWWATQEKLPNGLTLYSAWKPVAERSLKYFLYHSRKSKRSVEFHERVLSKIKEKARKRRPPLRDIAVETKKRVADRADTYYGITGALVIQMLALQGRSLSTETPKGVSPPDFMKSYLRTACDVILEDLDCFMLGLETVPVLKRKHKNIKGAHLLCLLSNGLLRLDRENFRKIASQHS